MKPISDQDHYEILETTRDASSKEVERAYRLQRATYAEDSLANSSLFDDADISVLRERIEVAYGILGDADKRRAYDEGLDPQKADSAGSADNSPVDLSADASVNTTEGRSVGLEQAPVAEPKRAPAPLTRAVDYEEVDEKSGDFDGPRLQRVRVRRDVSIDQISASTKINPLYLRFIEEERTADLPAAVYVRGFVRAYASYLGLDPDKVARSYMERFEEARERARSDSNRASPRRRSRHTA